MAKDATTATDETSQEAPKKKGGLKKILIIMVVVALVGGGVWNFMFKPEPKKEEPVPGEVVALEPIQINLAAGHYLRIGLALQLVEKAHKLDGSKALDAAIELFSGKEMVELSKPKEREHLKHELNEELHHRYHGEVLEVYFTEFVTQ